MTATSSFVNFKRLLIPRISDFTTPIFGAHEQSNSNMHAAVIESILISSSSDELMRIGIYVQEEPTYSLEFSGFDLSPNTLDGSPSSIVDKAKFFSNQIYTLTHTSGTKIFTLTSLSGDTESYTLTGSTEETQVINLSFVKSGLTLKWSSHQDLSSLTKATVVLSAKSRECFVANTILLEAYERQEVLPQSSLFLNPNDILYAYSDYRDHYFDCIVSYRELVELGTPTPP